MLKSVAIANRSSGSGSKLKHLELPFGRVFEPEEIDWPDCLDADLLVMFGGDGTIQHTVTAMIGQLQHRGNAADANHSPALAIVPYGTTNMSARTINRSRNRKDAVTTLRRTLQLDHAAKLTTHRHPLLKIVTADTVQYGYAFGVGAIANFVQDWRVRRGQTTAINQLRSLLSLLRGLRNADDHTSVTLNAQTMDVYALVLTTLRELIYGTRPFWGSARQGDAGVRATWIQSGTPGLFSHAPALLRGAPRMADIEGFDSRGYQQLELSCAGPLILDGEVYDYRNTPMTISSVDYVRWIAL